MIGLKSILPLVIIAGLLLTVCFIPSSEADGESLWINGIDVINNPGALPDEITFADNVLTLNNVGNLTGTHTVSSGMGDQTAVIVDNRGVGLTLNIVGDNNRLVNSGSSDNHAIYITSNLTITGNGELLATTTGDTAIMVGGTLTINGPSISSTSSSGPAIFGNGGLVISGGAVEGTLDSNNGMTISGSSSVTSNAIEVTEGDVTISGTCTLDVNNFMCEDGITITDWPTIEVGNYIIANSNPSDGVSTLLIEGGMITVAAGGMIDCNGNVTMTGGTVVFEGSLYDSGAAFVANGAGGDGMMVLSGGSITATGATAGRVLIGATDAIPLGNDVLIYLGANPLTNLTPVDKTLVVESDGVASISFPFAGYTVSFNNGGGTGTMTSQTKSGSYELPANGFIAPSGKVFKCWSVVIGSTSAVERNPGQTIDVTANTTVTAVWENAPATTFTVTFDANGGTGTMNAVSGVSGEYTLPECTYTAPEGKTFKCWSVGDTEKNVGDKITVSADTTVKAVWKESSTPSSGGNFPIGAVAGAVIGAVVVIGVAVFVLKRIGKI